jgi:hypothetical protein
VYGLFECFVKEEHEVLQEAKLSAEADSENWLAGCSETNRIPSDLSVHKTFKY